MSRPAYHHGVVGELATVDDQSGFPLSLYVAYFLGVGTGAHDETPALIEVPDRHGMRSLAGAGGRQYRDVRLAEERFPVDLLLHDAYRLLQPVLFGR